MREGSLERFDPENGRSERRDPWKGVHLARYRFAVSRIDACRVLDVACGTGYGLPVLQTRARTVVGLDADLAALRKAPLSAERGSDVVAADCGRLPFADRTFGAITSFETLEHLEDRRTFVAELRRVLSPDGLLILSTPNANITQPIDGTPRNPYHVHEYEPEELRRELETRFESVMLLGQKLSATIKVSPFADDHHRSPRTWRTRSRILLWRILNKFPPRFHDPASQLLWGHPLIAGESDYEFREDACEAAPVLIALCRGEVFRR